MIGRQHCAPAGIAVAVAAVGIGLLAQPLGRVRPSVGMDFRQAATRADRTSDGQLPANLVTNGDASRGFDGWTAGGNAIIEVKGRSTWFTIRDSGGATQNISLTTSAAGQYIVFVAHGSSERINADGTITGLPYLYGMALTPDGRRILAYFQGQQMLARPKTADEWVALSGVYRLPDGVGSVVVQLRQAERAGVPQNGSAARFDNIGAYLVSSASEGSALVSYWRRVTPLPEPVLRTDATESRPNP